MNVKTDDVQNLLLLAGRVPVRMASEDRMLERLALRLLETREAQWMATALAMRVCPACVWPLLPCPDCDDQTEPYCGKCDVHWGGREEEKGV